MDLDDRILLGVALMIAFCVFAPLIDVASKLAAQAVPVGVIVLGRGVVQAALMLPVVLVMGLRLHLSRRALRLAALRALLLVSSTYCFVAAVRVMPIADALAIAFVEPFIILLIGRLVLSEQVGPRRLAACAVGFIGSLFVIQPSFAAFGPVAFFPLGTALSFALYMLVTRRLSREVHPVAMQFHTALLAAILCLPLLALGTAADVASLTFAAPKGIFWLWVFCVGLASAVAHLAMTYALKFAPSATLAPLHYLEIVTATVLGYLVFGDFPNSLTWTGIAIIVASGLYVIHRERQVARAARLTLNPPAPELR
ncbi:Riboflavin transporter [Defluviimonas aquaemixtae]|uniref:Riboflavin transporter n=1 Tax=Albidovulum aquaemixtae TaxID=1542388 RepID=A0A2R8B2A6_9RHOB|nr:DMT family transporter [Defluviimonas aquaemixtae]SPH16751.1 Riboflavin transporter [Defluviimonas aquaemixtae]